MTQVNTSLLTANTGHLADAFSRTVSFNPMFPGFVLNGLMYQVEEVGISFAPSQRRPNINLLI